MRYLMIFLFWIGAMNLAYAQGLDDLMHRLQALQTLETEQQNSREQQYEGELVALQQERSQLQAQWQATVREGERLQAAIEDGRETLKTKRSELSERSHGLQDLYATWQQAVKDSRQNQQASLISAFYPENRQALLDLQTDSRQPQLKELKVLTQVLQQDITETGFAGRARGTYVDIQGQQQAGNLTRVGPFIASADGRILRYNESDGVLVELPNVLDTRLSSVIQADDYLSSTHVEPALVDPSRGQVLQQLTQVPDWQERLQQGGMIGYTILALGALGLLLAIWRFVDIWLLERRIHRQMKQLHEACEDNPLGRILKAYQQHAEMAVEMLEVKVQQLVMHEVPRLDRGLGLLKLMAAVAPMLGLLGTVAGMIITFQTITLVGSNDPKLMATGISQALITTVLGLIVAVPLLFSHSLVSARARAMVMLLSQQSLGLIAEAMEAQRPNASGASKPQREIHA